MKLSVVIAAHDAEAFVGAAIESVLRELPADAEVIVVDDGSRDGTARALAPFAGRVLLLANDEARGPGAARNRGAQAASGELLAFHDADDLVLPGRFDLLRAQLDADPALDLVFANGLQCDEDCRPRGPIIAPRHARRLAESCGVEEMLGGGIVYPQATMIRRASFWRIGGYAEERGEDWDFALRVSVALRMAFVDRPVFAYRRHPAGMTARRRQYGEALLAVLERFAAAHPELDRRALDRALASQLARLARLRLDDGDRAAGLDAWRRAIALAPTRLRYRWRLWQAQRAA